MKARLQTGRWCWWPVAGLRSAGLPFSLLETATGRVPADWAANIARDERFAQALVWQNPAVAENWFLAYRERLARGEDTLSRRSQREVLLATYLQRYTAKNDTIGFFGPVGWAELVAGGQVSEGDRPVLRHRSAHVEPRVVRAMLDQAALDPAQADDLVVRLIPTVSWNGSDLAVPPGRTVPLPSVPAAVVRAVTEWPTSGLRRLVEEVAVGEGLPEHDVRAAIAWLLECGYAALGPAVPMDGNPERSFDNSTGPLAILRQDLALLLNEAKSTHDPEAVALLMDRARTLVTNAAGADRITRTERRIGRTPIYIDEGIGSVAKVGVDLLSAVERPLRMALDSAAWLAHEVGATIEAEASRLFDDLAGRASGVRLDVLMAVLGPLLADPTVVSSPIVADFQARWEMIVGAPREDDVVVDGNDVDRIARALFPVRPALWVGAAQHSPDLMLARSATGHAWVLGELHVAVNTLENGVFYRQHPPAGWDLDSLSRADFPHGRVVTCFSSDDPQITPRTWPPLSSTSDDYRYWALARDAYPAPPGRPVTAASAAVVFRDGARRLVVDAPGWSAPLLEVLGDLLSGVAVNLFRPFRPTEHRGRVVIDGLVMHRASWQLDRATVLAQTRGLPRELARDLREAGVPQHAFIKSAEEPKPLYINLESDLLMRMMMRVVNRASSGVVSVTEMMPGPTELWLDPDLTGPRTSEFRFVAASRDEARIPWTAKGQPNDDE